MISMRAVALMEAERLALHEALAAMVQLADVRERMCSEAHEQNTDLHSQVLAAEKRGEEMEEKRDELKELLRERQAEHDNRETKQDAREERILAAYKEQIGELPTCDQARARAKLNNALAEEIPF